MNANQLLQLLHREAGVILKDSDCSERCLDFAKQNDQYYDDGGEGNGCVYLTVDQLNEFGGGIKNPKP